MNKKNLQFYKLPVEIAASKELTHSEKLIVAYLFTLFGNGRAFVATNAFLSTKIHVQKSVISPCLTKLESLGWITITNRQGNKRRITMRENPCVSGKFYRLYSPIATTKELTALEKVLLSYILSYTDNGQRFYAKNAVVSHILDISKEGFNTSRITFEEMGWIQVKYPKTPRRELVVINHPCNTLASSTDSEASEDIPVGVLINNSDLPKNNIRLPLNNHNKKIDNISDEIILIRGNIKPQKSPDTESSGTTFFDSTSIEKTSSTSGAAKDGDVYTDNKTGSEANISTKNEAAASTSQDEKPTSTKEPAAAPVNHTDEGAASSSADTRADITKRFDVYHHCGSYHNYVKVRNYIVHLLQENGDEVQTTHEANSITNSLTKDHLENVIETLGLTNTFSTR